MMVVVVVWLYVVLTNYWLETRSRERTEEEEEVGKEEW